MYVYMMKTDIVHLPPRARRGDIGEVILTLVALLWIFPFAFGASA